MKKIETIQGRAVPVSGNDIDTDRIIPARFLKEITFSRMGNYPFYDERYDSSGKPTKDHPFNRDEYQGANILFANSNFGCGSSREHAPQSLVRWGIRAIVAESFAEIFAGNCIMLGTPVVTASAADIERLQRHAAEEPGEEYVLDIREGTISYGNTTVEVSMPESRRSALLEGTWDSTSLLMSNAEAVKHTHERLSQQFI